MSSITAAKGSGQIPTPIKFWAVVVWLAVWQAVSMALGQEILLVSPVSVVIRTGKLALEAEFWQTIMFSFSRIAGGFFLAAILGTIMAALGRLSAGGGALSPSGSDDKINSCGFFYYSGPDLGIFQKLVHAYFFFNGLPCYIYQCFKRHSQH